MSFADDKVISIVVLCYNFETSIVDCLKSVSKQIGGATEIIVVDDASSDRSVEVIKKHFPKARLIVNEVNLGAAKSVIRGLKAASGEYISIIDGDDMYISNYRNTTLLNLCVKTNCGCVVSPLQIKKNGSIVSLRYKLKPSFFRMRMGLRVYLTGMLFRNFSSEELAALENLLNLGPRNHCDLSIVSFLLNRGTVCCINECFGQYNYVTEDGMTNYNSTHSRLDKRRIYRHLLATNENYFGRIYWGLKFKYFLNGFVGFWRY